MGLASRRLALSVNSAFSDSEIVTMHLVSSNVLPLFLKAVAMYFQFSLWYLLCVQGFSALEPSLSAGIDCCAWMNLHLTALAGAAASEALGTASCSPAGTGATA